MEHSEVKKLYALCQDYTSLLKKRVPYNKDNENWYNEWRDELNRLWKKIDSFVYEINSVFSYKDTEWNIIYSLIWHEDFVVIAPYSDSPLVDARTR